MHPRGRVRQLLGACEPWPVYHLRRARRRGPAHRPSRHLPPHGAHQGHRLPSAPMPAPEGFKVVWTLRKIDSGTTATYTVAHPKGAQPGCTCPDHKINKSVFKHIMALAALGLIARPKAARPVKARTRQLHARNARQAIAEAKALPVEAQSPPGGNGHPRRLAARRRPPVICRRVPPGRCRPCRSAERHGRPGRSLLPHLRRLR